MKLKAGMKLKHRTSGRVFEFIQFYNKQFSNMPYMDLLNTKSGKVETYQASGMQFFDIVNEETPKG